MHHYIGETNFLSVWAIEDRQMLYRKFFFFFMTIFNIQMAQTVSCLENDEVTLLQETILDRRRNINLPSLSIPFKDKI